MAQPVVHFEIIGRDPRALRSYYSDLFGWHAEDAPVAAEVSQPDEYGFVEKVETPDGTGVPGGIGGGPDFTPHTIAYFGVDDVEAALQSAERLGGTRVLGPVRNEDGGVTVGHFRDPEGNLVGVAGPK